MQRIKNFIARNFEGLAYFYQQLRYRVFFAIALSILVGALDGLGLTMFLPLLQMVNDAKQVNVEGLGNMRFLIEILQDAGVPFTLIAVLSVMIGFFVLKGLAKYLNGVYRTHLRQYFIRSLRVNLVRHFCKIGFSYYVFADVGRIQNTMSGEVERVSRAFQDYFRTAEQMILLLVYMGFAFVVDFRFALLVTVGGLLTNILYNFIYRKTKKISGNYTKGTHIFQGQIIQLVANFKYLKATGKLALFSAKLEKTISSIEENMRKIGFNNATLEALREPILIIIVSTVIVIQTELLNAPLGPILISLLFFYRALTALVTMQHSWNRYLEVSGSLDNMREFSRELKVNKEVSGQLDFSGDTVPIKLEHVGFSYGDRQILRDINLTIRRNETLALVGESGSGKTTLVNIIAGLIPCSDGSVYVGPMSLNDIDRVSYQQRIGYITQEPVIFNDTIYNNVTLWAEPTAENVANFNRAIARAALKEFIEQLPLQGDAVLGINGVNLSGGQKQRIFIARELYKDIDILIMDEATSALDGETEKVIQESIDSLKGAYTIVMVAHRLSTIKNADRIVVMSDGQIESIGTYRDLILHDSNFRKMAELQDL